MPKITPGNRLYLYQLLSRELGVRRQTLLPRVEEALAADGICPEDLSCADARELCEQLPEFIKLTVFKKGYVYATVIECAEYDQALSKLASGDGKKGTSSGKPWKRKRGAKALKPVKPRHVEKPAEKNVEAAGSAAEPETVAEPEAVPVAETEAETAAETEAITEAAPGVVAEAAPEVLAEPDPETAAEAEAAPEPAEEPDPDAAPEPEPKPELQPETQRTPSISLTITYIPEPEPEPSEDETLFSPAPEPEPEPVPEPVVPRIQSDLPRDFHTDVRCSSEQLSVLYQVLPCNVDPMATLEEDFRVARSTGALEGTRSNVTFSLRYLQADGKTPVTVTLRRSARAVAGKRWALTEVDAGSPEEVDLGGLNAATRGPWRHFPNASVTNDPERLFAQSVAIGSWDDALERLAQVAAPESWGPERRVLRSYLTMTFARVQAEGALLVSPEGRTAEFDTRLLTAEGSPVYARLSSLAGDIPWQLEDFSTEGAARAVTYVTSPAQVSFDASLASPELDGLAALLRSPRLATTAYDPIANEAVLLVPGNGGAVALAVRPDGYQAVASLPIPDAYVCARVTGAEQPSWLAVGIEG